MHIHKNILTLLALWSPTQLCLAAEAVSFPRPKEGVECIENQFIIQYDDTTEGNNLKQNMIDNPDKGVALVNEITSRNVHVVNFPTTEATKKWLKDAQGGIKYVEKDCMMYIDTLLDISSTTDHQNRNLAESIPYGILHVNALNVSDAYVGNRKVCIIDSGYDMGHPDLPNNTDSFGEFTGKSYVNGYEWYTDEDSHGTHVAGTIVALEGNNEGVVGVIRNGMTNLHIAKVFDSSGSTTTAIVIEAFENCVENGADVINMSLGGGPFNSIFQDAISNAETRGVLTFASSGNSYGSGLNYPASYEYVMSVASITEDFEHSAFSTYNEEVDICAPGSDVVSTIPGGGYDSYSGTSMACPHAVGVAALVWSHYPSIENFRLRNILQNTAMDLGSTGRDDYFGHGLIDAEAALEGLVIAFTPTVSPRPSETPSVSLLPSTSLAPTIPCLPFLLELLTDGYASETRWAVEDPDGNIVIEGNPTENNFQYVITECLPPVCDYTFYIYDSYGDGLCCEFGVGSYTVYYAGAEITSSFFGSGSVESANFGCVLPTVSPAPSLAPSTSAPIGQCKELKIQLLTDGYAYETSWTVTDPNGNIVVEGDDLEDNFQYRLSYCLPPLCNYTFTIFDSFGDGICCEYGQGSYSVYYNRDEVISGGNFISEESAEFGCIAETECVDSPLNFAIQGGNNGCSDLANNPERFCENSQLKAKSHCPNTCSTCVQYKCEDSRAKFRYGRSNYRCNQIPEDMIETVCEQDEAKKTCRKTCNYCDA